MNHPLLIGKGVYMRGLEEGDLDGPCYQWLNEAEYDSNHAVWPNSAKKMRALFEKVSDTKNDILLMIIHRESERHVGLIGLHEINWLHHHARLAVVVGELEMRRQGLGSEAVRLLSDHAFNRLNLHRVHAMVREDNTAALETFAKAGFQQEGRLQQAVRSHGRYFDLVNLARLAQG